MQLCDALEFAVLKRAHTVAGASGLGNVVRWVHVVDMPNPAAWVQPGMLLLTTGYAWPREEAALCELVYALHERQIAAIGLAVPQFFEHFPHAMRQIANQVGLPLIEIPWEIPFAQIAEELLQALVGQQYQQLAQSEAIHRALTGAAVEAESLQDIAETLGGLLDRAITIEDGDGNVLAAHRRPIGEDLVRRRTLEAGHTPPDYDALLEARGFSHLIGVATGPIRIPAMPEVGATARVVCPIRLKHEVVGRAWIIEGVRPLDDLDLRAAEQAAFIVALHLLHQRELETREARVGYAFLDALLEGTFTQTPQTLERARLFSFDPAGTYHVGLFLLHAALPISSEVFQRRERLATRIRQRLTRFGGPALVSLNGNQIPFLLRNDADAAQVWADLAAPDLSLTLSRAYNGVAGVRQGYSDVQAIVPLLQPNTFVPAKKLLLPRVLAGDRSAQAEFLDDLFAPLHAARNGDMFVATLVAYAEHGFQIGRAAQALFVHPKTLSYRIERIRSISGIDFDDPAVRFRVQLAVQLLQVGEHVKPTGKSP